jgi:hypothetical protein
MNTIANLLARDLSQRIEEIIKVDQADEPTVYAELTEYVATDRIQDQYRELFRAIADAKTKPHEGIGVWISGFFGSGKSSFAKNLGYVLANRSVLGQPAAELFKAQLGDAGTANWIDFVNLQIPSEVVMFDVSVDRAVRRSTEKIAEVMYTVLLRELDYAEDYDVAELEIELEAENKLDLFAARCQEMYGLEWRKVRKGAQKISRASALLHSLDPSTYPSPDAWSQSLRNISADITVGSFVARAFDLCARRRPGKALVFIIDEVGQYVARSVDKIEDLRAVVEEFGKEGKNRVTAHKVVAPVWIVVTSQEKLEEVVAALDSKRVELAKLQDRFKYRVDLAPADIREVATRRVLAKTDAGASKLGQLYRDCQGQLNTACRLERTTRRSSVSEEEFVQFYPYLPHFIELSIDIMSGIRLQPGAPKHLGGSNRTIIKQAYEMLVSPRTALAGAPVGRLVTLDKLFELVEGNLSSERQKDLSDIRERFRDDPEDVGWALRVAKAVCLLEFVRDLPRTDANIAACLVDAVGAAAPLAEVQRALARLQAAQFVRNTEEGWKLQTAKEKNWETERRGHLEPKQKDRNDIQRETLAEIFSDPKLKAYRYRDLRSFRLGITVDGVRAGEEGQITLAIQSADDRESWASRFAEMQDESRQPAHQNDLYWVFALTAEADDLVANLYASREMVKKYDQLRAMNRISHEEAACLQNEKGEVIRLQGRLRDKTSDALAAGAGLFRGYARHGADLGKTPAEIFKKLLDGVVPDLYGKLEMGARPLKGTEAEEVLKAANLAGLSQVFYGGAAGLGLVVKEGAKFVPNPSADVAKEVLDYLNREHAYGNRDTRTGKAVEGHFGGLGYGWDLDVLRVVLAVLFRAGSVELAHGGRRYDSYADPQSRVPFTNTPAFRATLFTPAKPIDLKTLTQAVEGYEGLTGRTVDVEKNAIAAAAKKWADEELRRTLPVQATAEAHRLPVTGTIQEYRGDLEAILAGAADDCVRTMAGEGASLAKARDQMQRIRDALSEQGLRQVRYARAAAGEMWPALAGRGENSDLAERAAALREHLDAETFYDALPAIRDDAQAVSAAYGATYLALHADRAVRFAAAIEEIKGRPDWAGISPDMQAPILVYLAARACAEADLPEGAVACRRCRATLSQLDSDLAALTGLRAQAIARIEELTAPVDRVERVRLAEFFGDALESEDAVEQAIERLREHLLKLLAEKVKIVLE